MSTQTTEAFATQRQVTLPSAFTLSRQVSIVGCGMVSPRVRSAKELVRLLLAGDLQESEATTARLLPLERLHAASGLSRRDVKKVDRFSLLGLAAAREALLAGGLTEDEVANCGIVTGNMMAGWTFTEPQLRALHTTGLTNISPYLATAWFPAAAQGQITIHLNMHGFAKTVTTDRCAGAQAIGMAYKHIRSERSEMLLAGAVEAPVTEFVESAFNGADGAPVVLTEAAAYLLLAANAGHGASVNAHSTFSLPDAGPSREEILARQLSELLRHSSAQPPVEVVVCNVPADRQLEAGIAAVVRDVMKAETPRLLFPTRLTGDCLAASGAIAAVVAYEMLMQKESPGSALVLSTGHQCGDLLRMSRRIV
jgi:3-oxoacyl-(acyl-carrier-protein) synthase